MGAQERRYNRVSYLLDAKVFQQVNPRITVVSKMTICLIKRAKKV